MDKNLDLDAAQRLYQVKVNQIKMIRRRGYDTSAESATFDKIPNYQTFLKIYIPFAKQKQNTLRGVLSQTYMNENGDKLVVFYADDDDKTQLGVDSVAAAIAEMERNKARSGVIITPKPLSPSASKKLDGLVAYNIQIFSEEEMSYDPTEHFLVPKHIPLSKEERTNFLQTNNINIDNMPIILASDIMARYYGMRGGDIVKIERENMYETMIIKSLAFKVIK